MAPNLKQKVIGIRPGEKIHEIMCPRDDSHLTIGFRDFFIIMPSIKFFDKNINYKISKIGEKGKFVESGFEYNSENNPNFLSLKEIKKLDVTSFISL